MEDEFTSTSLALHEMPPEETEEFLCPYFDGAKLILPPGYEQFKKKVEKNDDSSDDVVFTVRDTTDDGTPLRRSSRTKKRKQRYIYSDDESEEDFEGFTELKVPVPIIDSLGGPVPTCMFVNTGFSGGAGIDANKEMFKSLPRAHVQPTCGAEDERIEFTIEINESSDDDDDSSSQSHDRGVAKRSRVPVLVDDDDDSSNDNVNGPTNETVEPDIKVKDDPVFLSDDEVISSNSLNNGKESTSDEEKKHSSKENVSVQNETTVTGSDLKETQSTCVMSRVTERFCQEKGKTESNNDSSEQEPSEDKNDATCSNSGVVSSKLGDDAAARYMDQKEKQNIVVGESVPEKTSEASQVEGKDKETKTSQEKTESLCHTSTDSDRTKITENGTVGSGETKLTDGEKEEVRSEDSEKTEDLEPEEEHQLISEIKEKMKEYCSQKVQFETSVELSGNLAITADNEKTIRGSVAQVISRESCHTGKECICHTAFPFSYRNSSIISFLVKCTLLAKGVLIFCNALFGHLSRCSHKCCFKECSMLFFFQLTVRCQLCACRKNSPTWCRSCAKTSCNTTLNCSFKVNCTRQWTARWCRRSATSLLNQKRMTFNLDHNVGRFYTSKYFPRKRVKVIS